MKPFLLIGLLCVSAGAWGLGQAEDPQEVISRTWTWDQIRTLTISGEVQFTVQPGSQPRFIVATTRALFDQLSVYNWWGWSGIVVESGLKGPREKGPVKVIVETPDLGSLTIADQSTGTVRWPGTGGLLEVKERSAVTLEFHGKRLELTASWLSTAVVNGEADQIAANLRHQSRIDAGGLAVQTAELFADEESAYRTAPVTAGTARLRHGSRIEGTEGSAWSVQEDPGD